MAGRQLDPAGAGEDAGVVDLLRGAVEARQNAQHLQRVGPDDRRRRNVLIASQEKILRGR